MLLEEMLLSKPNLLHTMHADSGEGQVQTAALSVTLRSCTFTRYSYRSQKWECQLPPKETDMLHPEQQVEPPPGQRARRRECDKGKRYTRLRRLETGRREADASPHFALLAKALNISGSDQSGGTPYLLCSDAERGFGSVAVRPHHHDPHLEPGSGSGHSEPYLLARVGFFTAPLQRGLKASDRPITPPLGFQLKAGTVPGWAGQSARALCR